MGRCKAPCDGHTDPERYGELIRALLSSLTASGGLLEALEERMHDLAAAERFEEAALARERLRAIAEALARSRADTWLLGTARLVVRDHHGRLLRFANGWLVRDAADAPLPRQCPRERADELAAVRSWFEHHPVRVEEAGPSTAEPVDGGAELHRLLTRLRRRILPAAGRLERGG